MAKATTFFCTSGLSTMSKTVLEDPILDGYTRNSSEAYSMRLEDVEGLEEAEEDV